MNEPAPQIVRAGWHGAWLDAAAFALGLGLAWWLNWNTTDLVWSLWLSSLVVGYATIVWSIFGPLAFIGTKAWQNRQLWAGAPVMTTVLGGAALTIGGLFLLAFFTVHFGMFHYVHSVFLQGFFPVGGGRELRGFPHAATYLAVVRQYWVFLPAAFLAERQAFYFSPSPPAPPDTSVKAVDIAARIARNKPKSGMTGMMAPYRNVIRMHLLIFFFAGAHFAKLDNFAVYAVVYAVYFFPWRLLRKAKPPAPAIA